MQLLENLSIDGVGDGAAFVCGRCSHRLGPTTESYKDLCGLRERKIAEIGRLFEDPRRFVNDEFVYREFVCPNCGGLFDTEINRRDESPVHDIESIMSREAS
jgi:acetone carboxylase gamma subunit